MRLSSRFCLCYEAPQAKTSPARRWSTLINKKKWRFLLVLDLEPENQIIFNGARGGAAVCSGGVFFLHPRPEQKGDFCHGARIL